MINYLNKKKALSTRQMYLAGFQNDLQNYAWKIADIGIDNNNDGLIEQSLLEQSFKNLTLNFERNKSGSIIETNKAGKKLLYLFDWEIDYTNSLIIISSEHSLFELKPKWKIKTHTNGLLLFYEIKLSFETVKIAMSLQKERRLKKQSLTAYLPNYFLSLFSFLVIQYTLLSSAKGRKFLSFTSSR